MTITETTMGIPNNHPAAMLNEVNIRVRKESHTIPARNHDPTPFAITKLTDVNHMSQAPRPKTPPNKVRKNPIIRDPVIYKNIAVPKTYIKKGKTNMLNNISTAVPTISVIMKTIIPIHMKNRKKARAMKANPPVRRNGSAIVKKGRKFHRY